MWVREWQSIAHEGPSTPASRATGGPCASCGGVSPARALGVLLLMLNTIVQFAFIAAFPIWTLAAIIINIAAICALMRPLEDYQERRGYIE